MPQSNATWTLADLVDFEVLLARDVARQDSLDAQPLEERDRRIGREIARQSPPSPINSTRQSRRVLFHSWLKHRLQQTSSTTDFTPGAATALTFTLSSLLLALFGFISGKAVLLAVLTGAGLGSAPDEPVNVLFYLVCCIIPQLLLTLAAIGLMLTHGRLGGIRTPPPALRGLVALVIRPVFAWLLGKLWHSFEGEKRQEMAAAMGWLRGRTITHAEALRWPLIGLLHSFALGYATAILLGSLLSVQIWHQTFAWQTTVQAYTPERVHRVIEIFARPWSWAVPEGTGYPTLADVAATRFHRHQDPATLPPDATGSWWLFVVLAAFTYGFLPRMLLLLWGKWKLRSTLARERFDTLALDPLYERLAQPHVAWHGPDPTADSHASSLLPSESDDRSPKFMASPGPATLLIPADLVSAGLQTALLDRLPNWNGWNPTETIELDGTASGSRTVLERFSQPGVSEARQRILTLQEAFMPPTREVLNFLRDLRRAAGPQARILVGLIGKPSLEPLGQPVTSLQAEVWLSQIRSLGDANLDVQPVNPP
jgi:hypothetical protein